MATIYGIVKQNGGFINVSSDLGKGTRFTIYFRRGVGWGTQADDEEKSLAGNQGGVTILLVEDDPGLLSTITKMLQDKGYVVLGTSLPGDALRLAGEHAGEIDLLITDLTMPLMSGQELAKNIASRYPNIRHLFMSGHLEAEGPQSGVLNDIPYFIQKPFNTVNLIAKVQEVMSGR